MVPNNVRAIVMVVALAARPVSVMAQSGQTVPMELAQRLADTGGVARAQIFVGTLPPSMDSSVPLPKGVRLLGALVEKEPLNTTSLFYDTAQSSRSVAQAYGAELIRSGWKKTEAPGPLHGGFRETLFGGYTMYCRDNGSMVTVLTPPKSNTDLRVAVLKKPQGQDACESFVPQEMLERFRTPLPDLIAPPGAKMTMGSAGVTTGASGATIKTTSSLNSILESFSGQMRSAGWTPGAAAQTASLGSQTFHVVDAKKQQWQAVLTIYASDAAANTYYAFVDATNLTLESKGGSGGWLSVP